MAAITKRPSGKYSVRIRRNGHGLITKTFNNKADAERWARITESELDRGVFVDRSEAEATTLSEALVRYRREVVPTKKGRIQEEKRIGLWLSDPLAKRSLSSLKGKDLAIWRDKRLEVVSPATCVRDMALLSHVFTVARTDWGIAVSNPIADIRKPTVNNQRTRRFEGDEEARLMAACSSHPFLGRLIILALETGCRRSELVNLTWQQVDLGKSVILLADTKNGESRTVPLTTKAKEALGNRGIGRIFSHFPRSAWDTALQKAGITGLHFHDLRHESISRLFERGMNVMEVKSVSGHKTLTMLSRYTHLKPEDLLKKMQA